jgi:hypothetical protein
VQLRIGGGIEKNGHGGDRQHSVGQYRFAEQRIDHRALAALELAQDGQMQLALAETSAQSLCLGPIVSGHLSRLLEERRHLGKTLRQCLHCIE